MPATLNCDASASGGTRIAESSETESRRHTRHTVSNATADARDGGGPSRTGAGLPARSSSSHGGTGRPAVRRFASGGPAAGSSSPSGRRNAGEARASRAAGRGRAPGFAPGFAQASSASAARAWPRRASTRAGRRTARTAAARRPRGRARASRAASRGGRGARRAEWASGGTASREGGPDTIGVAAWRRGGVEARGTEAGAAARGRKRPTGRRDASPTRGECPRGIVPVHYAPRSRAPSRTAGDPCRFSRSPVS